MPDLPEVTTSIQGRNVRWVLTAAGSGAGIVLGLAGIKVLVTRPEFLPQLVSGGGLWFAALAIGMVMFRSEMRNFNSMQERHVVAQERLAENVGALVSKDDQRAREQDLLLNHLARQSDKILEELQTQRSARGGD